MKNVILLGIKHCGKSTQGKLLSSRLSLPFFDTDDMIFELTKKTPREIYASDGKEAFLKAEAEACRVLSKKSERFVAATGGGFCTNDEAVSILKPCGLFVFLEADEKTAGDRIVREIKISEDGKMSNLPAYIKSENPSSIEEVRAIFHRFFEERTALYRSICDVCVKMLPVSKEENLLRIVHALSLLEQ